MQLHSQSQLILDCRIGTLFRDPFFPSAPRYWGFWKKYVFLNLLGIETREDKKYCKGGALNRGVQREEMKIEGRKKR